MPVQYNLVRASGRPSLQGFRVACCSCIYCGADHGFVHLGVEPRLSAVGLEQGNNMVAKVVGKHRSEVVLCAFCGVRPCGRRTTKGCAQCLDGCLGSGVTSLGKNGYRSPIGCGLKRNHRVKHPAGARSEFMEGYAPGAVQTDPLTPFELFRNPCNRGIGHRKHNGVLRS